MAIDGSLTPSPDKFEKKSQKFPQRC